ncbi:MAG: PorT family protein [Balneolaceae bacterium]|nr:PorT family protein [Balneolaceae bacterium]MBO6545651.1 PorT family protein [Balneolaceae bacterium]MBO6647047.1 PorT family protein [Balneolaceae bacterium]
MKKLNILGLLILVVALIIGNTTNGNAQVLPKFGLKGGLNYAAFNNVDDVEYRPGILIGAFAEINIPASPMSVQPEVLYAQYGSDIEGSDASFKLNYIQVPVLLKFNFQSLAATPNVYFGPYTNFLINSEIANDAGSIDLEENTKNSTFGVIIGAGIDLSKFQFGVRYTAGLTNAFDDSFNDEAKNGAFALTVGVSL